MSELLNNANRHDRHTAGYCLRRVNGQLVCRFKFPQHARQGVPNTPHFYCERVKTGVRWRLYLPLNDPLLNTVNKWQAVSQVCSGVCCRCLSSCCYLCCLLLPTACVLGCLLPLPLPLLSPVQNANVDFKPLIDHYSALEYSTKYATKAEKGSKSFEKLLAVSLSKYEEVDGAESAQRVFSSLLVQTVGNRDWTAQEVAHALLGIPTTICTHRFNGASLAKAGTLRKGLSRDTPDGLSVLAESDMQKYLKRLQADNLSMRTLPSVFNQAAAVRVTARDAVDVGEVRAASFTEFHARYQIASGGSGLRPTTPVYIPTYLLLLLPTRSLLAALRERWTIRCEAPGVPDGVRRQACHAQLLGQAWT